VLLYIIENSSLINKLINQKLNITQVYVDLISCLYNHLICVFSIFISYLKLMFVLVTARPGKKKNRRNIFSSSLLNVCLAIMFV
jgi:hypothetical protein